MSIELTRRAFLQGLAAAIVVANAPPEVARAVEEKTKRETGWGFIVRGRQQDLLMFPPGVYPGPGIGDQGTSPLTYWWPEPLPIDDIVKAGANGTLKHWIELCPWGPYRAQMQVLIPAELQEKARNWRPRGLRW